MGKAASCGFFVSSVHVHVRYGRAVRGIRKGAPGLRSGLSTPTVSLTLLRGGDGDSQSSEEWCAYERPFISRNSFPTYRPQRTTLTLGVADRRSVRLFPRGRHQQNLFQELRRIHPLHVRDRQLDGLGKSQTRGPGLFLTRRSSHCHVC